MKKLTLSLGILLTLLTLIMLAFCFLQSPSFDDYVPVYLRKQFGPFGSIHWYLTECNGRYSTIPLFLLIAASPNLDSIYPFLLIFFILFSFFAVYRLLLTASRHLFTVRPEPSTLILFAALVSFTFLALIPEISSYYFWFATSITYLFPFNIFLLYLSAWISFFQTNRKWKYAIILMLLTLFLGGCNEVMMYFAFGIPFLIILMIWSARQPVPGQIYWIAASAMLMAVIVLAMPGNGARTHHYDPAQSLLSSITGSAFRTFRFWLILFTNPLFYISCAGMIIVCSFLDPSVITWFSRKRTGWPFELLVLIALVFGFDLVIRQLANYVVPPRATNILVCISLTGCWWIILMNASRFTPLSAYLKAHLDKVRPVFYCLFLFGLLGSAYFMQLISNIITLPTHHTILMNRVKIIQEAKANGRNIAVLPPYSREVQKELEKKFKSKARFVKEEFQFPPSFVYFKDEPFHKDYAYFYAEYYGIDTVATDTSKYARWGLTNITGY